LIVYIEGRTGHKIDLAMADPNEFSLVRGLWNLTQAADPNPKHQVSANATTFR
jgi:hypothetical protein